MTKLFLEGFPQRTVFADGCYTAFWKEKGVSSFLLTGRMLGFGRFVFIVLHVTGVTCLCLTVAIIFFQLNMLSFDYGRGFFQAFPRCFLISLHRN